MIEYRIDYLATVPQYLATLARWQDAEWRHLNSPAYDLAARVQDYQQACQSAAVPLMLVAHSNQRPLGSVRLVESDLDTHPELTPWLASLYVHPPYRRHGIGSALITRLETETQRLGHAQLFLFSEAHTAFYQHRGYDVWARETYQHCAITIMSKTLN